MANVNYDTLTIEIKTDSSKANRSINGLSQALLKLEKTAKNLDWEQLKIAQKYLEDVANISFDNVSKGLQDVVSAFKQMNREAEKYGKKANLKDEPYSPNFTMEESQLPSIVKPNWQTIDTREITMAKKEAEDIIDVEYRMIDGLKAKLRSLFDENLADRLYSVFENFDKGIQQSSADISLLKQEVQRLVVAEQVGDADKDRLSGLRAVISALTQISSQAKIAEKSMADFNKSTEGEGDEGGDRRGQDGGKQMGKLQKLFSAFKRVLFYRLVRRLIQLVFQAVKQGIENIAKFDKEFNSAMSNIKSSITYLKNAIGSAFKPIIEMLTPLITNLIVRFADIFNKIAEIMSAMQGKDVFLKSKMSAEDFARSLQKATLSIDELNVIDQQGGSFEEAQISDEAKETASIFTSILNTVKEIWALIKPVLVDIIGVARILINKLLPKIVPLLKGVMSILKPIAQLFGILLDDTHELVEDSLTNFVDMVASILNFVGQIVQDLMPLLVPIIKVVASIINIINTVLNHIFQLFKKITDTIGSFDALHGILTGIAIVLGVIVNAIASLFSLINAILTVIGDIVRGDWEAIGSDWDNAMSQISTSWTEDFIGSIASTPIAQQGVEARTPNINGTSSGSQPTETQVNVYLDGEQIASRVNKMNNNRGASTFRGGTLSYVK